MPAEKTSENKTTKKPKKSWLDEWAENADGYHYPALHQEHIDKSPEPMVIGR